MGGAENLGIIRLVPVTTALFQVIAGDQWRDTDVSATTGTNTRRIWVIATNTAGTGAGVRPHGSAIDCNFNGMAGSGMLLGCCDSTGHMDLRGNAAVVTNYYFVGYLE